MCGCSDGLKRFVGYKFVVGWTKDAAESTAVEGAAKNKQRSASRLSSASSTDIEGTWYMSEPKKVEFKIYKWGESKGPYSCSQCGACWELEYDRASTIGSSIGSTVELIDDNENDNEKKGNDKEKKGNDKATERQRQAEKNGWKYMETLQVWKIHPTYSRTMSSVEVHVCFDCEAKWANVS